MGLATNLLNPAFLLDVVKGLIGAALIGGLKYGGDYLLRLRLKKRLEEDRYTPAEIKKFAAENRDPYVRPDCQDNNPAGSDSALNRRSLFEEIDRLLGPPLQARFSLLLADSGMGKTTFLRRYYAYHWSRPKRSGRFKLVVVPLNQTDCNDIINRIDVQDRGDTVLLLDALDEDNAAIADFCKRFQQIVAVAGRFRAVLITCRTQFLADAACIPEEVDLPPPAGPAGLTGGPDRKVHRIYVSPFDDQQVKKYLAARFPCWRNPVFRVRAGRAAERFKDLMSRPLLLTYIPDLISEKKEPPYTVQVYRAIVDNWLTRETGKRRLASKPEDLLGFCEDFAVQLYTQGRNRMPTAELDDLAKHYSVTLDAHEVRERSLLHNDAEGHWSFAHRSIMEYFLVRSLSSAKDRPSWAGQPWTDQMRVFGREMLLSGECVRLPYADLKGVALKRLRLSYADLNGTDLTGADLSEARLRNVNLDSVNLGGACLDNADLCGLNLRQVRGLTLRQAISAVSDEATSWEATSWPEERTLGGHSAEVTGVAMSADGRRAVSASFDYTLKVWDVDSGRELRTLTDRSDRVCGVAVSGDGRRAVSCGDLTLKVWDVESGCELRTLRSFGFYGVALSGDGRLAAAPSRETHVTVTLKVWDLTTGVWNQRVTLKGHGWYEFSSCAFSPNGDFILSGSKNGEVMVWFPPPQWV